MRIEKNFLVLVLNIIACLVLFICLGFFVLSTPLEPGGNGGQFDIFLFLDQYGLLFVFLLTIISLILLYINQKMFFQTQKEDIADILTKKSLPDVEDKEYFLIFEKVFDAAPMGVFQTSRDGKLIFANSKCAGIFGFDSPKEFAADVNGNVEGMRGVYVNKDARDALLKKLYQERKTWCRFTEQFYKKDGSVFHLSCYMSLRYDHGHDEECILGFVDDVTSVVETENKLRVSEARYRDLIEKSNSIMLKVGVDGCITYANSFAKKIFGYTEDELFNKHIVGTIVNSAIMNEDDMNKILKEICTSKDGVVFKESLNMCRDGSEIWIAWSNNALVDDNGEVNEILFVGQDMTARKELEMSLCNQLTAERAMKDVSKLLADSNLDDMDQAINDSLSCVNNFLGAYHTCFYTFDETGFVKAFYHQCESGQHDEARDFIERFLLSASSWWFDKLLTDEFFIFTVDSDVPEDLIQVKDAFLKYKFSRVIIVPVRHQGRLVGFLVSSARSIEPCWGEGESGVMKICGQMFLNVLDQKEAQEEILRSRESFDMAVRGAYLGLFDWNVDTGEVIFNDIWFRMLGYSPREFPHTVDTWKSLLHPEDKEHVLKALTKYLNGTNPFYSEEFRMKVKGGDWKWLRAQGHVVKRDEDGKPLRMIGIQRDITEFRSTADQLVYQKGIFSALSENMPAGIFVKDVKNDFRFVFWNKYMEKLFGLSQDDVTGKNDYDLFDKEFSDFYLKYDKRLVQTKQVQQISGERIQAVDGERWVHTIKVPILNEKNEVVFLLGILEDITSQQQLENQLRHTQKMQSIGQLAAGIAHEVKNPLAIILLAAEGMAFNKSIGSDEKMLNKIKMIKDSAEKANNVVMELLKFSRLADTEMKSMDLHEAINDAYFLAKNRNKEKNIEFEKCYFQESLACHGNSVLLEQVFVNLFNNSIDAIEDSGKIIVRTKVKDSLISKKEIVVEVEDDGCGISNGIVSKIFDPFFTTKNVGVGTGLGLSTVFMILEKHNGSVKVESTEGEGAKFILTFPFCDEPIEED